jgi:hypothetical protein
MKNIFTEERFLLYSPGLQKYIGDDETHRIFFLQIGFNGECWETYGLLAHYKSFQMYDFFFFARMINDNINTTEEVEKLINKDPIPFMLLFKGSELPFVIHKNDLGVLCQRVMNMANFNLDKFSDNFDIKSKNQIYYLSLKKWNVPPHLARVYYHKGQHMLFLSSLTIRGYKKLVDLINKEGYDISIDPEDIVGLGFLIIAEKILSIKYDIGPFEKYFTEELEQIEQDDLDNLNDFLSSYIDELNRNNSNPNIELLALETGVDPEMARQLVENIEKRVKKMNKFGK